MDKLIEINEMIVVGRGSSPKTVQWYRECLGAFRDWLRQNNHPDDPKEWDSMLMWSYLADLRTTPRKTRTGREFFLSPSSIATHYRAINATFNRLHDMGMLPKNPMKGVTKPKVESRMKDVFRDDDFNRLVEAAQEGQQRERDTAILYLLFDTGIRREEIRNIKLTDINFATREIKIHGKGAVDRPVFMVDQTVIYMQKYDMRKRKQGCPYFFQTDEGEQMSQTGIYEIMRRIGNRAGVKANPHKFRRSYCSSMLQSGASTLVVQRTMGHSKPDVTNMYFTIYNPALQQLHEQHSPVKRLK